MTRVLKQNTAFRQRIFRATRTGSEFPTENRTPLE